MSARNDLETRLADLQKLRRLHARGAVPLKELADAIGPLMRHPSAELQLQLDRLWSNARTRPYPLAAVFAPRRNSSIRPVQELWWLQLLVIVAQGFCTRRYWIVPRKLDQEALTVVETIQVARAAWVRYGNDRGSAVLGDVIDAIELLLDCVPQSLTLDGSYLVKDGVRIGRTLTPKEALFMRLLVASNGKPVAFIKFLNQGIKRVDIIKARFLRDPAFCFLEDHIVSASGIGYQLIY